MFAAIPKRFQLPPLPHDTNVWLGMISQSSKKQEIGSHRKFSSKGKNGATIETFRNENEDHFQLVEEVQSVKAGMLALL